MCWLSPTPSVCLLAWSHSNRHAYLFCGFVRADCAVRCWWACGIATQSKCSTTCSFVVQKKVHKSKILGKYGYSNTLRINGKKTGKDSPAITRRRCLSGSSERPDRCQRSPLRWGRKTKSKSILHTGVSTPVWPTQPGLVPEYPGVSTWGWCTLLRYLHEYQVWPT